MSRFQEDVCWHNVNAKREKKEVEEERRKLRLLQVREESKKLAKKIRTKVTAEKNKQFKNLEDKKLKELNSWRESTLNHKYNDYRSAIFQVGAAHKAAVEENKKLYEHYHIHSPNISTKPIKRAETIDSNKPERNNKNESKTNSESTQRENIKKTYESPAIESKKIKEIEKRVGFCFVEPCLESSSCQSLEEDSRLTESINAPGSSGLAKTSTDILPGNKKKTACDYTTSNLRKTPIVVDIDVENCENISVSECDVDDIHVQDNRQFSRVVRLTPQKNVSTKILMVNNDIQSSIIKESSANPNSVTTNLPKPSESDFGKTEIYLNKKNLNINQPFKKRISTISDLLKKNDDTKCFSLDTNQKQDSVEFPCVRNAGDESKTIKFCCEVTDLKDTEKHHDSEVCQNAAEFRNENPSSVKKLPYAPILKKDMNDSNFAEAVTKNCENQTCTATSKYISQKVNTPLGDIFKPCSTNSEISIDKSVNDKKSDKIIISEVPKLYGNLSNKSRSIPNKSFKKRPKLKNCLEFTEHHYPHGNDQTAPSTICSNANSKDKSQNSISFKDPSRGFSKTETEDLVQYFDYNNKFGKNYNQPNNIIHSEERNVHTLNAKELAEIERDYTSKLCDCGKIREAAERRGHSALEREQLRRDCNNLTDKLDKLLNKYPRLLSKNTEFISSAEASHKIAEQEKNMNTFVEDVLLRPAIITCPYVDGAKNNGSKFPSLNLADIPNQTMKSNASTFSTCSNLLDLVNDHSRQLKMCLDTDNNDPQKIAHLKKLMNRVEQLRNALMEELKFETRLIRKEQDTPNLPNKLITLKQDTTASNKSHKNIGTVKKNFINSSAKVAKNQSLTCKDDTGPCKSPLEIIINIKGDDVNYEKRGQSNASKNLLGIQRGGKLIGDLKKNIDESALYSLESNSTSYKSLPSNAFKQCTPKLTRPKKNDTKQKYDKNLQKQQKELHPLVEHYVQRLLGMNRESVKGLCVSSSEIATPSSSIINNTNNGRDNEIMSEMKLKRVEDFISENQSLINQLEHSIQSQNFVSSDDSVKFLNSIWKSRFENITNANANVNKKINVPKQKSDFPNKIIDIKAITKKSRNESLNNILQGNEEISKNENNQQKQDNSKTAKHPCPEIQIERYAELTENCTQRIKELTELITRVREEKRKLLEVTFSSGSDTGQNSTEYYELPDNPKNTKDSSRFVNNDNKGLPSCNASKNLILNSRGGTLDTNAVFELTKSLDNEDCCSVSLKKVPIKLRRKISLSLDSGISGSRPVTELDQNPECCPNLTDTHVRSPSFSNQTKIKPPATMRRFSPQMMCGDEIHELSTITEVETPGTSKINNTAIATKNFNQETSNMGNFQGFPTFEQYVKKLNMDLSNLKAEQTIQLQTDYNECLEAIKKAKARGIDINDFPNISSYFECQYTPELQNSNTDSNVINIINNMRKESININSFPSREQYLKNCVKSPSQEFIDTDSLDNISADNVISLSSVSDTCSESLDIEQELRKRNLLKNTFRRNRTFKTNNYAESTRNNLNPQLCRKVSLVSESGIDDISTSNSLGDSKGKPKIVLSVNANKNESDNSTTLPTPGTGEDTSYLRKIETTTSNIGKPLNLRDFLFKEFQKRVPSSISSTTCSDDSIRNLFLLTILDNLTPNVDEIHGGTGATIDRQKTSTPMGSNESSCRSAKESTRLFSGASQISSVHYHENEKKNICKKCCKIGNCICEEQFI